MAEALVLMFDRLGEQAIYMDEVLNDEPTFAGIYPTTWQELEDRGFIKARPGIAWCRYQLTGYGWLEAQKLKGLLETPGFEQRLGRLNAVLKGFVKGRRDDGFEQVHVVAAKAQVSEGWLHNILESRFWERELNRVGAEFDDSKTMVIIPIRFGMEQL
jgi:hypothetical protein